MLDFEKIRSIQSLPHLSFEDSKLAIFTRLHKYEDALPLALAELDRLRSELAAAQVGLVVEWREDVGFSHARIGRFWLVVRRDGWRLEFSQSSISTPDFVASGPETGPAGKAAAEAAARLRAAGWTPSHARLEWRSNDWQHYLHLCIDSLSPELLFAAQFQDGTWNVFNRTNDAAPCILRRGTTKTAAARVAEWCATNLPSLHLPPFPGASQ